MLNSVRNQKKFQELLFMGILILLCLGLSSFRYFYTGAKVFVFLNWNLFLACIPWALTSLLILNPSLQTRKGITLMVLFVWLLFFPNAPYILTDLFHLRLRAEIPIWFDLVLILSFAWTGLLFGFLSLWDLEKIYKNSVNPIWLTIFSVALLFLGSFGVYLGRYLRWNSWDIVQHPFNLFVDISDRFLNPFEHLGTWGMTVFLGIFLNMIYWSFRFVVKREI